MTTHEALKGHFEFLIALADKLEPKQVRLYEHVYERVPYGNWTVVFGRHLMRLRFRYDGSRSTLWVQQADALPTEWYPDWSLVKPEEVVSDDRFGPGEHSEMERIICERFAV